MIKTASKTTNAKFKFRLWHLFFVTAIIAMGVSIHPFSILVSAVWVVLCFSAILSSRLDRLAALALLCFFFCVYWLLAPTVLNSGTRNWRTICTNQHRQLMIALLNYELTNGQLPAAAARDAANNPAHSWRVKILPFIEEVDLYRRYDFAEPWDGPNNSMLVKEMPEAYRCPVRDHGNRTHYKLVVGPGSLFDTGIVPTTANILDGAGNTVAIVEDAAHPVNWMEPEGISIDDAVKLFQNTNRGNATHQRDRLLSRTYSSGAMALYDGSIYWSGSSENEAELRKIFGISDGTGDINSLKPFAVSEIKPGKQAILTVYICTMLASLGYIIYQKT